MEGTWDRQDIFMGLDMEDGSLYVLDGDEFGYTNGQLCIMYNPYTMSIALMYQSMWLNLGPWHMPKNWTLV